MEELQQVKEAHEQEILDKPNVVGVGLGYKEVGGLATGHLAVVVLVRQKVPPQGLDGLARIPAQLDGVPTDVIQVGELRALQARTDRWRPARGGVSLGHFRITAGTFGCVVRDRATGARLILSNNHVLANSNDASAGDPILQPGPHDGGKVDSDTIAHLARFCPIQFSTQPGTCPLARSFADAGNTLARLLGSSHRLEVIQSRPSAVNQVDAAVARPLAESDIVDEILEIGIVAGKVEASLNMEVRKSGRTTAFTTGRVTVLNATVDVSYGPGRTARFEDQIVTSAMSQGGDSGSLLVDGNSQRAVGLLYAGSDRATIHSPIQFVLDCLEVDMLAETDAQAADAGISPARVAEVKRAYQDELLAKANVVGLGIGQRQKAGQETGEPALVVMVTQKVPVSQLAPEDVIPRQIEGVPVDVQEVGEIRAL